MDMVEITHVPILKNIFIHNSFEHFDMEVLVEQIFSIYYVNYIRI